MNPLEAFYASLAGCAAVYAKKACKALGVSPAGIAIRCKPYAGAGSSDSQHLVVVKEDVLLLSEQIRHRVARRHRWKEPERVVEVWQKSYVGVREWWLSSAEFEVVDLGR